MIELRLGSKIKMVWSDWGGQFLSKEYDDLFAATRISYSD